jgi:4-aminobutyrate aminotransferase-like enzyme
MVDEVQSGFGRTGKFFAFEHYGIVPDIVAMSKAASGGLIPIGITAIRKDLDFKAPREHSNTFGGSPQACFVCLKVIEIIEKEKLIERARILGNYLDSSLRKALSSDGFLDTKKYIQVLPSGIGLMRKVDILTNYGRPWPEMRDLIVEKAIDNGLWLMGAGICAIRLMPPLVVKTEEIDEGIDKFIQAIKDAVTYFLKL